MSVLSFIPEAAQWNGFNSYERMQEMVKEGLATASIDKERNLVTFKYHRKVMYDNLWLKYPETLECRGHVYDMTTGKMVSAPVRKSFNYGENGWWKDVPLDTPVRAFHKYNGSMAAVSYRGDELIVSTTGSTKSDYAMRARQRAAEIFHKFAKFTSVFEVCDSEADPHIVDEKDGMHLLGLRSLETGQFHAAPNSKSPLIRSLEEILNLAQFAKHEGWMVYMLDDVDGLYPCKVKTHYYINKKKLMRASAKSVEQMYNDPVAWMARNFKAPSYCLDAFVVGLILSNYPMETWKGMTDQERRAEIEYLLNQ